MGHTQNEKQFFLMETTKADHQLSEIFYFIKISSVLAELWIFFYFVWCFLSKKDHFQLKQLWQDSAAQQWWYSTILAANTISYTGKFAKMVHPAFLGENGGGSPHHTVPTGARTQIIAVLYDSLTVTLINWVLYSIIIGIN